MFSFLEQYIYIETTLICESQAPNSLRGIFSLPPNFPRKNPENQSKPAEKRGGIFSRQYPLGGGGGGGAWLGGRGGGRRLGTLFLINRRVCYRLRINVHFRRKQKQGPNFFLRLKQYKLFYANQERCYSCWAPELGTLVMIRVTASTHDAVSREFYKVDLVSGDTTKYVENSLHLRGWGSPLIIPSPCQPISCFPILISLLPSAVS